METTKPDTDNLPLPLDMDLVLNWLDKVVHRADSVEDATTELIDDIYDIGDMTDDELFHLCRHLKRSGRFGEKFGLVVVMDGRAAGWSPRID